MPPDVSLVFETFNDRPHSRIRFTDVVEAWKRQTRASRVLEWIVVAPRDPTAPEKRLLEGLPIRWLVRPDLRYYQQKNAGIEQSHGAFVALADSDALPADDWLERALEALEASDASVALVTGRSRYLPGPFSREMAIAQLPNQADHAHDTTHFLAHNVLLRADIVRQRLFSADSIRLGSDTHLAARLIEAGYRLRYDPSLRFTHNYSRHWTRLYRNCVLTGYAYGSFQRYLGAPPPDRLKDFAGRVRLLSARWREMRRPLEIPIWRFPLTLLFFVAYSAAVAHGYEMAIHGKRKPFR